MTLDLENNMETFKVELPEKESKINWDKFYNDLTGFEDWCQEWKDYHMNKHEPL